MEPRGGTEEGGKDGNDMTCNAPRQDEGQEDQGTRKEHGGPGNSTSVGS